MEYKEVAIELVCNQFTMRNVKIYLFSHSSECYLMIEYYGAIL